MTNNLKKENWRMDKSNTFVPQKYRSGFTSPSCKAPSGPKTSLNMEKTDRKTWLKRLGWGGFLFFLFKGLAWIAVWTLGWKAVCN
jgi:hypothetical protein